MAITQRFSITRGNAGISLIEALSRELSCSKKLAKRLLDDRKVFVNERRVWMAKHRLAPGDRIEVQGYEESPAPVQIPLLFENEDFIIAAKPPGLLADGDGSVESLLRKRLRLPALRAVHRLDRDTSGCLLFARNEDARQAAIKEFDSQRVTKLYLALVLGEVPSELGRVSSPIDGKPAETRLSILDRSSFGALIEAQLITGRMHQIRRHLGTLGLLVAGDKQYAGRTRTSRTERQVLRQMLHAWKLEIRALGIRALARPPEDFVEFASQLKLRFSF